MIDKMKRDAHHLWSAEADERGRRVLRRSRQEPEMFDQEEATQERQASRRNASKEAARETVEACWGLFGASLCDSPTLCEEIPVSVSRAFNAADRSEEPPKVHTWAELRNAFGPAAVQEARKAIANGMRIRMASKYLDVPFLVAAEILDVMPEVDKTAVKMAVDAVRESTHEIEADPNAPTITGRIAHILREFGGRKVAIDEAAKKLLEEYWGPYGAEMTKEIRKRVRADLAHRWMVKNGIDEAASSYWSRYFGQYASDWLKEIPKRITPSKSR